jgi:hypothetical protein
MAGADFIVPNPRNITVRSVCPGGIVKAPFISQIRHDEILCHGLLKCVRAGVVKSFVNEAMLRKVESTGFALKELQKLPDLIVELKSGSKVAIELELTQKSAQRYWELFNAYRSRTGLKAILFIVESRACLEAIVRAAERAMFQATPIGFVELSAWEKNAALATVSFPEFNPRLAEM